MPKHRRTGKSTTTVRPITRADAEHNAAAAMAAALAAVGDLYRAVDSADRVHAPELANGLRVAADRIDAGINLALDALEDVLPPHANTAPGVTP